MATKLSPHDPADATRWQPPGLDRSLLVHPPEPATTGWPPGAPPEAAWAGADGWALWIDDDGEVHTAVRHTGFTGRRVTAILRWSLWSQLTGEHPAPGDGQVRALVLSVETDPGSRRAVGRLVVVPAAPYDPALERDEAFALARVDLGFRSGAPNPKWTGRALACGALAAALLLPFAALAAVDLLLTSDQEQSSPIIVFVPAMIGFAGFLVADRARREAPVPRLAPLFAELVPSRLVPALLARRRSRRGIVVLPPGPDRPAGAVVHPKRPSDCPVPATAGDVWAWWTDDAGVSHSFGPRVRWSRGRVLGRVRTALWNRPELHGEEVLAIVVRRLPGSEARLSAVYETARGRRGVPAEQAWHAAIEDLRWRAGDRFGAGAWKTVDVLRAGACAAVLVLLPVLLLHLALVVWLRPSALWVPALYVPAFVAYEMAKGWRRDRISVTEAGAGVLPPTADGTDVEEMLHTLRAGAEGHALP